MHSKGSVTKILKILTFSSLNLHDHPNMLVLSKILHGAVHSRSMDLVDRSAQHKLPVMLYQNDDPVVIGTK